MLLAFRNSQSLVKYHGFAIIKARKLVNYMVLASHRATKHFQIQPFGLHNSPRYLGTSTSNLASNFAIQNIGNFQTSFGFAKSHKVL